MRPRHVLSISAGVGRLGSFSAPFREDGFARPGTGDRQLQALLEGGDLVGDAQSRVVRRPTIGQMPRDLPVGRTIAVPTPDARDIPSVALVRNTAQTHLIDSDQRSVELAVSSVSYGSLGVAVPGNRVVLPLPRKP